MRTRTASIVIALLALACNIGHAQQQASGANIRAGTLPLTAIQAQADSTVICNNSGGSAVPTACAATGTGAPVLANGPTLGSFSAASLTFTGSAGAGFADFPSQASAPSTPASNHFRLFSDSSGRFAWIGSNGFVRTLDGTAITASRTYTLPDLAGTFTLLGNTTTGSGSTLVLATSPTLTTPTLGAASATSLGLTGAAGAGYVELSPQSSSTSTPAANYIRLYSSAAGKLAWMGSSGFVRTLDGSITADRAYTLPDQAGTLTVLGNTTTGSGSTIVLATSPTLTTPNIGSATGSGLSLSAGTATGTVTSSSGAAAWVASTIDGQGARLTLQQGALNRWIISKNNTSETGSNAGSNFNIQAFDDSGTLIDTPFNIQRVAGGTTTIARPTTISGGTFSLSGAVSAAAWTTAGIGIKTSAATYTDTTSSGTIASNYVHVMATPTLAASSATTYTDAYTFNCAGAPVAGTNVTITFGGCGRFSGPITVVSSSANALNVGASGRTNPAFQVDDSTASQATGVKVTGNAAGTAPVITAISSGSNENLQLSAKGTGNVLLGSSSTATATAGAATCNAQRCVITSESLTTAAGGYYTLTWTNNQVAATSIVSCAPDNGTNTTDSLLIGRITPGSGSATVRVKNDNTISALNGTIKLSCAVF